MAMSKDLFVKLRDDWYEKAESATRWKGKFECVKEIFEILTGKEDINVEIKCNISQFPYRRAKQFFNIIVDWIANENHVFTRIGLFRLMPKLIDAMPKKVLKEYQATLLESLLTKQWAEKKKNCLELVTPTLIKFWLKSGVELKSDDMKPHILAALKSRGKEQRFSVCDFIAKCTMFPNKKITKQIKELMDDREIAPLLAICAMNDKEQTVKVAGCMAMHGLDACGIIGQGRKPNRDLVIKWDELKWNKRGKKNLERAKAEYRMICNRMMCHDDEVIFRAMKNGQIEQPRVDDEKYDEKTDEKYNEEYDEKQVENVQNQRLRSRDEILAGGVLRSPLPHVLYDKKLIKMPTRIEEGRPIYKKSLEDTQKAVAAASKFAECTIENAMNALNNLVEDFGADDLRASAKITYRVRAMVPIAEELLEANVCKDKMDAIIGLAKGVMGWTGSSSRNPQLAKIFLKLISDACAKGKCEKDQTGLYNVYLLWALERLSEPKFNALATECLLNTFYQFHPKVVMTSIEKLLLDPDDPSKDPLKNDKNWGAVIKFIGDAIMNFGVNNFYVNRTINIIHQKLPQAKDKNSKEACYYALCALYQQLGLSWKDVLLSNASKGVKKTLNKTFSVMKDVGAWKQLRFTKFEKSAPLKKKQKRQKKIIKKEQKEGPHKEEKEEKKQRYTGNILDDFKNEIAEFQRNYNADKIQQIAENNVNELTNPNSSFNKALDKYAEIITAIDILSDQFQKKLDETKQFVKENYNFDTAEYAKWNLDIMMLWIHSLENGRFVKYSDVLRNGFVESGIDCGEELPYLATSDLSCPPFNIKNFRDKRHLVEHFKSLYKNNLII